MQTSKTIMWTVKGKILHFAEFKTKITELTEKSRADTGTKISWWAHTPNCKGYCNIESFESSEAALLYLKDWVKNCDELAKSATMEKIAIFGNPSDELKAALSTLEPKYLEFFGGFTKDIPENKPSDTSDIIWMLKGEIEDIAKFHHSMEVLTEKTAKESGSLTHFWTVSSDSHYFAVVERYADKDAAIEHLATWRENGGLFLNAVKLKSFTTFSHLVPELDASLSGLNPKKLTFMAGFAR